MKKTLILFIVVIWGFSSIVVQAAGHTHGDGCYTTTEGHKHTGSAETGGGCYGTPVYHTHSGSSSTGGGCYGTPVYHTHSGSSSTGGGCYSTPVTCGGNIVANTITNGSWTVGPGAKEYAVGDCPFCKQTHGYCILCGIGFSCNGFRCGGHPKTVTTYKCEKCGTAYSGTGTCEKIVSYATACGHDETTPVGYELSCGKTEQTIERYELSCGKAECEPTRTLTCTIPEGTGNTPEDKTPKPSEEPKPTKTPKPSEEPKPSEKPIIVPDEKPSEELEEIKIEIDPSDFDFNVKYEFVEEGVSIKIIPSNPLALAENPYSWDNKITWNKNTECIYSEPGVFYISVKNIHDEIKTKIVTIDLSEKTVTILDEEVPLSSGIKKSFPIGKIFAVFLMFTLIGGFILLILLFLKNGKAVVLDKNTEIKLGTVKINHKKDAFETFINDKILMNQESDELLIIPQKNMVKKFIGYSLLVKSSEGSINTEIAEAIEVNF